MGTFKASAGKVDLAPPVGVWMSGFGARLDPSEGIHDPVMARAVLLDDSQTQLAIVSVDILGFSTEQVAIMRRRIASNCSIPSANILISTTHTHSGPATVPLLGVLGIVDEKWVATALDKVVDLVSSLPSQLKPAQIGYGSKVVPGLGYNRENRDQPHDEELGALAINANDGMPIATLVNYSLHPVILGPSNRHMSGDFAGELARHLDRGRGGTTLFLQGSCGDVDPDVFSQRGWGQGGFDDTIEMGEILSHAAADALEGALLTGEVKLGVKSNIIDIPMDPPPSADELAAIKAEFESSYQTSSADPADRGGKITWKAMIDWVNELSDAINTNTVPKTLPVEVFTASINEYRLVGVPFEPFSDIGLTIKRNLKPCKTMFIGYANGCYGYVTTTWAKNKGGYGPSSSYRWYRLLTPVGFGADELLIQESVRLAGS